MLRQRLFSKLVIKLVFLSMFALFLAGSTSAYGQHNPDFEIGEIIYQNPLSSPEDVDDWVKECAKEGHPIITSSPENEDMLRLYSERHFLLWCPEDFPDKIAVSWDFLPIERVDERGLAMFWIAATGEDGKDLFDPSLAEREGHYIQYRMGDINALHVSYFRRNKYNKEVNFQIAALRKSAVDAGSPLMAKGADPIPDTHYANEPYRMEVIKFGPYFRLSINDLTILEWTDDGKDAPIMKGGKIGFRQMRGLIADYANLEVRRLEGR